MIDRREAISRGPYYIKVLIDALQVDEMSRLMGKLFPDGMCSWVDCKRNRTIF